MYSQDCNYQLQQVIVHKSRTGNFAAIMVGYEEFMSPNNPLVIGLVGS